MTATGNTAPPNGRIVYVVGCGRSGTTILGFCLGNAKDAVDLGEVLDFARFHGEPNGFESGTENHEFWRNVCGHLIQDSRWPGFDAFAKLQRRFDSHVSTFPVLVLARVLGPFGLRRYRQALAALYEAILREARQRTCIDSSKYPSRLLHLAAILPPHQLAVIHLVRDPESLVRAFSTSDQGPPRAAIMVLLYYAFINTAARTLIMFHRAVPAARLRFESFVIEPESQLRKVGSQIGFDLETAIAKIRVGTPLKRGCIFNGNRMRMQAEVVLKRRSVIEAKVPQSGGWLLRALRYAFMR